MYVHRALSVIVDNKCGVQHSSSHEDCTLLCKIGELNRGKIHKKQRKHACLTVSCLKDSVHRGVYSHSLVLKKRRIHGL